MKGWIYVISNKAMPGVIKVGYSNKDPKERAQELGTGSPHPYTVEYEALLDNPKQVEKLAHDMLAFVNAGKEWFECDVSVALRAIKKVCENRTVYFEHHPLAVKPEITVNAAPPALKPQLPIAPATSQLSTDELISRAGKGDTEAQYALGCRYDTGDGVRKNLKEAYRLFLDASMQGHTLANLSAGKAHLTGRGAEKDEEMAIPFILAAAKDGNAEAQYNLAELAYMEWLDKSQCDGKPYEDFSFEMMNKAADQNYLPAIHGLGIAHSLKNEYTHAVDCYRKAAEQGFHLTQRHLADSLVDGRGCKRDLIAAKHWYALAAEGKDKVAVKRLGNWDSVEAEYYPNGA